MKKIQGPALCGFADVFSKPGDAVIGERGEEKIVIIRAPQTPHPASAALIGAVAAPKFKAGTTKTPPKLKFSAHTMATGQRMAKLDVKGGSKHKTSVQNAKTVAAHAQQVAKRASNLKPPKGAGVHGYVLIGAAVPPHFAAHATPTSKGVALKIKLPSLAQIKSDAKALAKTADKLSKAADTHKSSMKKVADKSATAQKSVKNNAHIHGYIGVDANGLSAGMPGYDPTTDPTATPDANGLYPGQAGYDPTTAGTAVAPSGDWQAQLQADTDAVAALPGPTASPPYGVPGARPTDYASAVAFEKALDPTNLSLDDVAKTGPAGGGVPDSNGLDPTFYFSNPGDPNMGNAPNQDTITLPTADDPIGDLIVWWTGKFAFLNVGSYSEFNPTGAYPGAAAPNGGPGSGLELHEDGWYRWRAQYEDDQHRMYDRRLYKQENETVDQLVKDSLNQNFGPLIGRPDLSVLNTPGEGRERLSGPSPTAGLKFDCSTGGFFWWWHEAPPTAKSVQMDLYVKKAQLDWDAAVAAAKADYLNAIAILKQDQAAATTFSRQATADTATLNQKISLQQTQQQADEAQASSQADIAQTQLDMESQKSDLAMSTMQSQLDAQQQQLDLDTQKAMLQEAQAEDAASAAADAGGGGYAPAPADDGGGDAGGDDTGGESASDAAAAAIDSGDATVVGELTVLETERHKREFADEGVVDGTGTLIGVDDYGNVE